MAHLLPPPDKQPLEALGVGKYISLFACVTGDVHLQPNMTETEEKVS